MFRLRYTYSYVSLMFFKIVCNYFRITSFLKEKKKIVTLYLAWNPLNTYYDITLFTRKFIGFIPQLWLHCFLGENWKHRILYRFLQKAPRNTKTKQNKSALGSVSTHVRIAIVDYTSTPYSKSSFFSLFSPGQRISMNRHSIDSYIIQRSVRFWIDWKFL